jgi:hypothetical protein
MDRVAVRCPLVGTLQLLVLVSVAAVTCAVVVFLATYTHSRALLAFAVGVTGGLVNAQVFRIHLFTIVIVAWLLTTRKQAEIRFGTAILVMACAGLLGITVFTGDLVNSPSLALQLLALAASASAILTRSDARDRRVMLFGLLTVCTLGSLVGLLQFGHVIPAVLWHPDVSALGRPVGIYSEPDWLGLFSAIGIVLAWRTEMRPLWRNLLLAANGLACILAFARASWLALVVSMIAAWLLRLFRNRKTSRKTRGRFSAILVLGAIAVVPLFVSPTLRTDLQARIVRIVDSSNRDVSATARMQQDNSLILLGETAGPLGHGLSASGRVGVSGLLDLGAGSPNNVGSNWLLSMWLDGKLLAIPLIALFLLTAGRHGGSLPGQLFVLVLCNSLFSNGTFIPIAWLLLGLSLARTGRLLAERGVLSSKPEDLRLKVGQEG